MRAASVSCSRKMWMARFTHSRCMSPMWRSPEKARTTSSSWPRRTTAFTRLMLTTMAAATLRRFGRLHCSTRRTGRDRERRQCRTPTSAPRTSTRSSVSLAHLPSTPTPTRCMWWEKPRRAAAYFERLHAIDITTGNEKFGGPVAITASVPGNGFGSSGGTLNFDPKWEHNRAGLAALKRVRVRRLRLTRRQRPLARLDHFVQRFQFAANKRVVHGTEWYRSRGVDGRRRAGCG